MFYKGCLRRDKNFLLSFFSFFFKNLSDPNVSRAISNTDFVLWDDSFNCFFFIHSVAMRREVSEPASNVVKALLVGIYIDNLDSQSISLSLMLELEGHSISSTAGALCPLLGRSLRHFVRRRFFKFSVASFCDFWRASILYLFVEIHLSLYRFWFLSRKVTSVYLRDKAHVTPSIGQWI